MARLTGGPINIVYLDAQNIDNWLNGPISGQSPTQFVATPAANFRLEYAGVGLTFDANGNPLSGMITGIRVLQFATLWMQFEDIQIAIQSYRGFVADNNAEGLFAVIFSGDDIMSRAMSSILLDQFNGYAGNDSIDGNAGDDTLVGGAGNDSLIGDGGRDTLLGGDGSDFYGIDDDDNVVETQGGTLGGIDTVRYNGAQGSVTIGANVENLVLGSGRNGTGNELGNSITGNSALNRLFGQAGDDTLQGGAENDTLDGGKGADLMQGGNDADTYIVDSVFDRVDETGVAGGRDAVESSVTYSLAVADGQVTGDVANLILRGKASIDATGNGLANLLQGNSGKNRLTGLDGNDTLEGGAGADTMEGGNGNDTYSINSTADLIVETGSDPLDLVVANMSVDLNATPFRSIESVALTGSAALNATGTDTGNQLIGNAGANRLLGFGSLDELRGGASNDTLDGGEGDDIMVGGAGSDTYIVDSPDDIVIGELASRAGGFDTVHSSAKKYTMSDSVETLNLEPGAANGTGNDQRNLISGNEIENLLDGQGGRDTLSGGDGNDTLDGDDPDADKLIGGGGNDLFIAGDGDTTIESKAGAAGGIDTVQYVGSRTFTLAANIENLELLNTGNVSVTGNGLDNNIIGHAGENHLRGMAGNDILNGGGGRLDTLDGGAGADTMVGGGAYVLYVVDNVQDVIDSSGPGDGDVQSSISFNLAENGTTVIGALRGLSLTGTRAINGTGTSAGNSIIGNSAANVLDGGGGGDNLVGGAGNDRLVTNGDWHDQLDGGTGADTMEAGGGDDNYIVDTRRDVIIEVADPSGGRDTVFSLVNYTLLDGLENLVLVGNMSLTGVGNSLDNIVNGGHIANKLFALGGNDSMFGGDGNDTIDGGIGNDTMLGGEGNDTFLIDSAGDVLDETFWGGIDTAITMVTYSLSSVTAAKVENLTLAAGAGDLNGTGNAFSNIIRGNEGKNLLSGGDENDTIAGGGGFDFLFGDAGNDSIDAGTGDDAIFGLHGDDTLFGGAGKDQFFYEGVQDGHDLIRGFDGSSTGGQDIVDFESLFDILVITTADRDGRVQITDRGAAVDIRIDTDGDGSFELFAVTIQTSDAISLGPDILVGSL